MAFFSSAIDTLQTLVKRKRNKLPHDGKRKKAVVQQPINTPI